ncbi:hypothetical protein [Aliikangiella maris]|uniref:Uncharacterized protein n=2 Tax=Aliikangiella maris TaxID=3162458 RepID=A0ABV2BQG7_9GAMM
MFKYAIKNTALAAAFLAVSAGGLQAATNEFLNGSFETGDYTGWQLDEYSPNVSDFGTWGIVQNNQQVNYGEQLFDYFDQVFLPAFSPSLPKTFSTPDGNYMAVQFQLSGQTHRLYQDVTLSQRAKKLSFDMEYASFSDFGDDQKVAVHIRDLNDNILETLFVTVEGASPYATPMINYAFDITAYRGQTIRVDIELVCYRFFFDLALDNFKIEKSAVPPGWDKGLKNGWVGDIPPGLETLPEGFSFGKKEGWGDEYNPQ